MKLAIIPARGGSKRIPRKNIKLFHNVPMLAWTIMAAQKSGCFDRIIVSTDDAEIAEVGRTYGAESPFIRPAALADDYTTTVDVVRHAISWVSDNVSLPSSVCCLYATAPFLRPEDLRTGLTVLNSNGLNYVFSATTYDFPVQRALRKTSEGRVEMLMPEHFLTRSQDLTEYFHDAGQFYWGTPKAWLSGEPVFSTNSAMVELPRWRVQDIDTVEDWIQAELMFNLVRQSNEIRN